MIASRSPLRWPALSAALVLTVSCGGGEGGGTAGRDGPERPNVLWIVWDTVRADRLSIYGHETDTTPHLREWAEGARVFDCMAASCWTAPSHASMFTGLWPSEHKVARLNVQLSDEVDTVASLLRDDGGYQTYLFSANPLVGEMTNLGKGFDVEEHSFTPQLQQRALQIVLGKLDPEDRSNKMREQIENSGGSGWFVKAVGELANERFFHFLDGRDPEKPFFAFLNYMEAHRVRIPPRSRRAEVMTPEEVDASYSFDQTQDRMKRISFGFLEPYSEEEERLVGSVYDAALRELDGFLHEVLSRLEADGLLDETVVILTSDHGEHLGDHGSYMHHFSVYDGLMRVPLVVWAPWALEPGVEETAVMHVDLFPTVLELTGVEGPERSGPVSLTNPRRDRVLVGEYVRAGMRLLAPYRQEFPDWDYRPYTRRLWAVRQGPYKFIRAADGEVQLFDIEKDPGELNNLAESDPKAVRVFSERLDAWLESRELVKEAATRELTEQEIAQLKALGYM